MSPDALKACRWSSPRRRDLPHLTAQTPLLDEVLTDPTALVLRPGVLGPESVAALARETFETVPEAEFCVACHQATGGNPLYLQALLAALVADGVTPTAGSTARVDDVGPQPVARAVALRLSRLSPAAGGLARAVAILGQSADLELAATLAGLDRLTATTAAADLMRAELLRSDTGLEFTHPVVRAAVYDKLAPAERVDAHRRAAGLLTEAGAEPEQAASHLLLAPPIGDAQVVSVLRTAAASVSSRGAGSEAMVFLRRALAEPPPDDQRADVLTELGMVESLVDFPASIEHFREATELTDDPGRLAAVTLACGRTLGLTGANTAEAIEMLRAAIDQAGTEHVELREEATAHLVGAAWHERDFYPVAREFLDALDENELAGGLGSDMLRATLAHDELRRAADRDRTISLAERSLESGAIEGITAQSIYYALDALRAGEAFGPALAGYERALATARRRGDLLNVGGLLGFRGWLLIEQGDLRAAESDIREGIGFATDHGAPIHRMYLAVFLSDFLRERGELGDAERALSALELGERVPETFPFTFFLLTRGKLRLAQRAAGAALSDFSAIERIAEGLGLRNPAEWPWRSGMARALHALDRDREARELADEELAIARGWGAGRPIGAALRTLSVLEEGADGERRLRDAVDVLAAAPARLEHAKALIELGSALRRRNQRSAARELLREGVELAQRCGATALVAHGNDELAATGARPRNIVVVGVDSLTASERRVAQLASEEMTNKAIAQELFVTVKTVEVHLSSVYRKLDIGSRRQLAGAILAPAQAAVTD